MFSLVVKNQTEQQISAGSQPENDRAGRFTAEKNLIIACSRTDFGFDEITLVSDILQQDLDWEFIYAAAYRNGVLPLVSWNLLKNFTSDLPAEVENSISDFFHEHASHNLFLTGRLIEIVKLLEAADIPALPFKGATLAQQAYGNPALRQFIDLDVLVQPKHFDDAVKLLEANGFQLPFDARRRKPATFFFNRRKDIGLMSSDRRVRLELHWKLSGAHFALPFELAQLWARLEKIKLGGSRLNSLPFDDSFIYLCLHGARHGFERLAWICDLRESVNRRETGGRAIDWEEIFRRARLHGCEKVVELGVFLIGEFFGDRIDCPNAERIESDEVFRKIAARLRDKLFSDEATNTEIGDWYWYHLFLKERKIDRMKLHLHYFFWYLRLAFTPNSKDKAVFRLPAAFYPLYFILRPSRLLLNRFK